jgi:ABC-2 type transport system permease protein
VKVLAIGINGVRRLLRDRSNYFFVFVLPLGIIILIGSLFGSGFQTTVGLVAPSEGLGSDLAARIEALPDIEVIRFEDVDSMILAVERSALQAGVHIPSDTDELLTGGGEAALGYIARPDSVGPQLQALIAVAVTRFGSEVTAARIADGDLAAQLVSAQALAENLEPVGVVALSTGEPMFPAGFGQFDLGASTQLVLFMFLTGLTGSAALIQSRQLGVSRRMLSTPTSPRTILTGETLGRFGVVLVQGLYIVVVTLVAFGVNWGDPIGAAAVIVLFGLVCAGAAMLMGTLFRNDEQAGGVGVMLGLGLAALGGAMVPVEVMPAGMRSVSKAIPHSWAIDAFSELVRRDASVIDILPQLGVLAIFAASFLALATWRFRVVLTRET